MPLYSDELQLTLLWSAKAGCTFAVRWFFLHSGVLEEAMRYPPNGWPHDYRNAVFCKRAGYIEGLERAFAPDMRIVKFVRDPFERCVSAYLAYCQAAHKDHRAEHHGVLGGLSRHLGRPITPEETFTFREFVSLLGSLDLDTCDMHLARQVSAWERSRPERHVEIVPIEISTALVPFLERRLGFPSSDLNLLRESGHHTVRHGDGEFCGDTQFTKTAGTKCPPCRSFYDPQLAEAVRSLYSEDFARYGYSPQLPAAG